MRAVRSTVFAVMAVMGLVAASCGGGGRGGGGGALPGSGQTIKLWDGQ